MTALPQGRPRRSPARCTSYYASIGGDGCPPSCQPIPGHCRGRQSGHFLETGSLHLPLAALRQFPRRPVCTHSMPSVGRGAPPRRPLPTAPLAKKRVIAQPVRTLAVAIRNTPAPAYADRGSLSFCGERKGGKNAVKTKVLKSFPRLRCRSSRPFLPRELE